jgi:transcriptional regulator with XRE-family HTH domain
MTDEQKLDAVAGFSDDVIAKLTEAFFETIKSEGWGKRDLAKISGLNETAIGHILSGRRLNPTIETIALLARALQRRPELTLKNVRPQGNAAPPERPATSTTGVIEPQRLMFSLPDGNMRLYSQGLLPGAGVPHRDTSMTGSGGLLIQAPEREKAE